MLCGTIPALGSSHSSQSKSWSFLKQCVNFVFLSLIYMWSVFLILEYCRVRVFQIVEALANQFQNYLFEFLLCVSRNLCFLIFHGGFKKLRSMPFPECSTKVALGTENLASVYFQVFFADCKMLSTRSKFHGNGVFINSLYLLDNSPVI